MNTHALRPFHLLRVSTLFVLACLISNPAQAVTIYGTSSYSPHAVFRVDGPATQTIISSGGNLQDLFTVEPWVGTGLLVVSTNGSTYFNDVNGDGSIVSVDRVTGAQTVVSNNSISLAAGGESALAEPRYLDFDLNGDLIVGDFFGGLIRVNPANGAQTTISAGGLLGQVSGTAVESTGNFLVTDSSAARVVRVTPGGSQSLLASGGFLDWPVDLVLDDAGTIFVTDFIDGQIIRIDPISGTQTVIASGGNLTSLYGIDFYGGYLYVGNYPGRIVRVDPTSGAQFVETTTPWPSPVAGVAVVPEPASALLLLLGLIAPLIHRFRRRARRGN